MTTITENLKQGDNQRPIPPEMPKWQKYAWCGVAILTGGTVLLLLHSAYLVPAMSVLYILRTALMPNFSTQNFTPYTHNPSVTRILMIFGALAAASIARVDDNWSDEFQIEYIGLFLMNVFIVGFYCDILTQPFKFLVKSGERVGRPSRFVTTVLTIAAFAGLMWVAGVMSTTTYPGGWFSGSLMLLAHFVNWGIAVRLLTLLGKRFACGGKQ